MPIAGLWQARTKGAHMRFSVGCEIGYDVGEQATLIFNIEAMRGGRQRVVSERLTITPNLPAVEEPTAVTPVPAGAVTLHTVVKGDTLSGIASKYKVSIASIKTANKMTKDTVVLGSKIKIPR